ncbi:MAG: hypothetical protein JSR75_12000 [Proteobacteria bacterium]|nr:hypothetical protein [Pseudomonadota bacterium]
MAAAQAGATASAPTLPTDFPPDVQAVEPAVLQDALSGKVFRVQPARGAGWRLEFRPNGYAFINTTNGQADSGRWSVQGTQLCVQWQSLPGGCSEMRLKQDALYLKRASNAEVVALRPD